MFPHRNSTWCGFNHRVFLKLHLEVIWNLNYPDRVHFYQTEFGIVISCQLLINHFQRIKKKSKACLTKYVRKMSFGFGPLFSVTDINCLTTLGNMFHDTFHKISKLNHTSAPTYQDLRKFNTSHFSGPPLPFYAEL